MQQLIKNKYITTSLLYEVPGEREMPGHDELVDFLEDIGVIVDQDNNVFVLDEGQYEKLRGFVRAM